VCSATFNQPTDMALTDLQHARLAAAAASYRAMFDPPDAALGTAAEALAEAGADYTQVQLDAVETALAALTPPRARETALDAAIGEALTVAGAAL
jgi:hypothetical protein